MARGRPRKDKQAKVTPLHVLEGETKMDRFLASYQTWHDCQRCPLAQERPREEIVYADGNPYAPLFIVGGAPGKEETESLLPFVGEAGRLLNQLLVSVSGEEEMRELWKWYRKVTHTSANMKEFHSKALAWRQQKFFITNILGCCPPENRAPIPPEIEPCWERVYNLLYIVDPKIVLALGKVPYQVLTKSKSGITDKRGTTTTMKIPGRMRELSYTVMPAFDPAYLLRRADWNLADGDYAKTQRDIWEAMGAVGYPVIDESELQLEKKA